jgi:hypothetical protein
VTHVGPFAREALDAEYLASAWNRERRAFT